MLPFDRALLGDAGNGDSDGTGDAPTYNCRGIAFNSPIHQRDTSSTVEDQAPTLSRDMLTLYFASNRDAGNGFDLFMATRSSATATFGQAMSLSALNSGADDSGPSISANGLRLYFQSDRNGPKSLFFSERASVDDPFTSVTPISVSLPNAGAPDISVDEKTLYFASTDSASNSELWMMTRDSVGASWKAPAILQMLTDPASDGGPSVDAAGTTLYFESQRFDASTDVMVATRSDTGAMFSGAVREPVASMAGRGEYGPDISYDDRALALSLNLAVGLGQTDIWIATRECPQGP